MGRARRVGRGAARASCSACDGEERIGAVLSEDEEAPVGGGDRQVRTGCPIKAKKNRVKQTLRTQHKRPSKSGLV